MKLKRKKFLDYPVDVISRSAHYACASSRIHCTVQCVKSVESDSALLYCELNAGQLTTSYDSTTS